MRKESHYEQLDHMGRCRDRRVRAGHRAGAARIVRAVSAGLCILVLAFGCRSEISPAHQMFGTSNPSFEYERSAGKSKIKAGTNVSGTITTEYDSVTGNLTKLEAKINSNAADVVDAEGRRIPNMDAIRAGEFAMRVEEQRINHETIRAVVPEALAFFRSLIPAPGPVPTPPTEAEPRPP